MSGSSKNLKRRFTKGDQIRAHLAAGGDQPWQDPGMRRYARELAKDLAADLVEIEPLGDGWLFAGRFESTGPWATWQSVTGIQTPYGVFWEVLEAAHRFAETIADWADWSQPQTGNRFRWGCCGDSRRLAFAAKRTRDPDWTYTPPAPMATVHQVGEAMRLESRLRSRYPDLGPHTAAQLGDWTRDRIEAYLYLIDRLANTTTITRS